MFVIHCTKLTIKFSSCAVAVVADLRILKWNYPFTLNNNYYGTVSKPPKLRAIFTSS